jgi:hypothetical protein
MKGDAGFYVLTLRVRKAPPGKSGEKRPRGD